MNVAKGSYIRYSFDGTWVHPPGRPVKGGMRVHEDGYTLRNGDCVLVVSDPVFNRDNVYFAALMLDGRIRRTSWLLKEIGDP